MKQADPLQEEAGKHFSLSWHYKLFFWLIVGSVTWATLSTAWSGFEKYGVIVGCTFLWFYTLTVSYRVEILGSTITFFRLIGKKTTDARDITNIQDSLCSIKVIYEGGQIRVTNLLQNYSGLIMSLRSFHRPPEVTGKDSVAPCLDSPEPKNLEIRNFEQLPKGNIRRNNNFYAAALAAAMFVGLGSSIVADGKVKYHGVIAFEGQPAVIFGACIICFGLYFIYYLFFEAETGELNLGELHELDDFDIDIDGYNANFTIEHTVTVSGTSCISVFYYRLEVRFNKELNVGVNIKQRDRVEHFLWLIGITRLFDIHTSNRHFDSHYRVKCSSPSLFETIFDSHVMSMLEDFDRSYPPIRKKNGILRITDAGFRYVEGPYAEDQRLFNPHRGRIEDLYRELTKIMREIEGKF